MHQIGFQKFLIESDTLQWCACEIDLAWKVSNFYCNSADTYHGHSGGSFDLLVHPKRFSLKQQYWNNCYHSAQIWLNYLSLLHPAFFKILPITLSASPWAYISALSKKSSKESGWRRCGICAYLFLDHTRFCRSRRKWVHQSVVFLWKLIVLVLNLRHQTWFPKVTHDPIDNAETFRPEAPRLRYSISGLAGTVL